MWVWRGRRGYPLSTTPVVETLHISPPLTVLYPSARVLTARCPFGEGLTYSVADLPEAHPSRRAHVAPVHRDSVGRLAGEGKRRRKGRGQAHKGHPTIIAQTRTTLSNP